jgi:hypothetical protein
MGKGIAVTSGLADWTRNPAIHRSGMQYNFSGMLRDGAMQLSHDWA